MNNNTVLLIVEVNVVNWSQKEIANVVFGQVVVSLNAMSEVAMKGMWNESNGAKEREEGRFRP